MLSKTLLSIQRAVSVFPESSSTCFPARILSALQSLLHSNFGYQVFQRRSIPITCSIPWIFQNCSDSPAYCCSLAKNYCKDSFQLSACMNSSRHKSIHTSIHLSRQPLSQVTNSLPVCQPKCQCFISLTQKHHGKTVSSLGVRS